jgi:Ca-activated chloride channel family protein
MTQFRFGLRLLFGMLLSMLLWVSFGGTASAQNGDRAVIDTDVTQGALRVVTATGIVECPLKHTAVKADISGFIARVTVTQTFYNPYDENIEAIYVFPLPNTAAVDDMTMVIGERKIVGVIKRRADARAMYEQAVSQGITASLLEQERPNIFTQTVGNIKPKTEVKIVISYIDVLKYDMGTYEFHFPMVVGPRYIPGAPIVKDVPIDDVNLPTPDGVKKNTGTGTVPNTDKVPDASRITPPALKPNERNGHDITLSVMLDAGVPFHDLKVVNHIANVDLGRKNNASVVLSPADSVPNKDFVMRYTVVGEKPEMAVLTNCPDSGKGYFILMVQPRLEDEKAAPPREMVFLVDVSGSMSGQPTEKVKQCMRDFLASSKSNDTLQVITFASSANKVFEKPVPVTPENIKKALDFTNGYQGGGGTEMLKGIKMVIDEPIDPNRVRVAIMLTDGFIGNEAEIIAAVGKASSNQLYFWTIGIGSSPNRFLLDGVAKQGGGMSQVVELSTDPKDIVDKMVERIHKAQLSNVKINWNGLQVFETYPRRISGLWAGRPIIMYGRYSDGGNAAIKISGMAEGKPIDYTLNVTLPNGNATEHDVLPKVWARQKIEDLSEQMFYGDDPQVVEEITNVALDYKLMSQYTSFVAIDTKDIDNITEPPKPPRRMVVAVPIPDGTDYEGFFGSDDGINTREIRIDFHAYSLNEYNGKDMYDRPISNAREQGVKKLPVKGISPNRPSTVAGSSAKLNRSPVTSAMPASPSLQQSGKKQLGVVNGIITGMAFTDVKPNHWANDSDGYDNSYTYRDTEDYKKQLKQGETALTEAAELQKKGDLPAALLRYQQALVLASATQNNYTINTATTGIQDVSDAISKKQLKDYPILAKKLNLELRDISLHDAIQKVGKATGINIDFIDGSLVDAAEMSGVKQLRLTYLDLRRATVAQAMDWILTPAHLTRTMNKDNAITIGTTRRMPGQSAWVYRIGDIAMPIDKDKDAKPIADPIGHAVRLALDQKDNVILINPTQLLVWGDEKLHANVLALLQALKDPKADISKVVDNKTPTIELAELQKLQKLTAARWIARADQREKRFNAQQRNQTMNAINTFTLPLLASASRGSIDIEALTELQIAWASPEISKRLENDDARFIMLRSAWAINQAELQLPTNKELYELATTVYKVSEKQFINCLHSLNEQPNNNSRYLAALYNAVLLENDSYNNSDRTVIPNFPEINKLLLKQREGYLTVFPVIAAALLTPSKTNDEALAKAITENKIIGNDAILLTAFAAKERGGILAKTMRENLPELTGKQAIDGNITIYANRMTERVMAQK